MSHKQWVMSHGSQFRWVIGHSKWPTACSGPAATSQSQPAFQLFICLPYLAGSGRSLRGRTWSRLDTVWSRTDRRREWERDSCVYRSTWSAVCDVRHRSSRGVRSYLSRTCWLPCVRSELSRSPQPRPAADNSRWIPPSDSSRYLLPDL